MPIRARKINDELVYALVKATNDQSVAAVGSNVHYGATEKPVRSDDFRNPTEGDALTVESANASDESTLVTLVNDIKVIYGFHIGDGLVHDEVDATNVVTNVDATDAATAATLITEIKADYNAHRTDTDAHPNSDSTNAVTNADATDQATGITLANEVKADLNAHITAASSYTLVRMTEA